MNKKLRKVLEIMIINHRANETGMVQWEAVPEEFANTLNLKEWNKLQDFVVDAAEEKLECEDEG